MEAKSGKIMPTHCCCKYYLRTDRRTTPSEHCITEVLIQKRKEKEKTREETRAKGSLTKFCVQHSPWLRTVPVGVSGELTDSRFSASGADCHQWGKMWEWFCALCPVPSHLCRTSCVCLWMQWVRGGVRTL